MNHMDLSKSPSHEYTSDDFIYQTQSWTDSMPQELSKLDVALLKRWDKAMAAGAFRYNIDHIVTRIFPGDKQYVGQLNTLRATERRKPQDITSVSQPLNVKAFNFSWVKKDEIIFDLVNLTCKKSSQQVTNESNGEVIENGHFSNDIAKDSIGNTLESSVQNSGETTQNGCSPISSIEGAHVSNSPDIHRLIINVSPMEYGHCLLVPQINALNPQVLTETSLEVAIELMLLSNHRGFRMGFNSLCAFASVNHQHFHVYYLEHELIVDHCPVQHLGGQYYEFTALPCSGFALQLHGTTVKEMARQAHSISSYFHTSDLAHNVFICRGTVFGEERDSTLTTIRLFIWPRKKFIGNKSSEFNVACIELGGHLPIKEEEGYNKMTEADVDAILADANLPGDQYEQIRETITRMGQVGVLTNNESH